MSSNIIKLIKLIFLVVVLAILFMVCGMSLKSTPESREKKIISFLEKKYNSKFEIVQLTDSGENVIMSEVSCDGATFCPEIKDKGVYFYKYEVLSLSDNVTFEVEYLDKRLVDEIEETTTYYSLVNEDIILNDMYNYAIDTLGADKCVKEEHSIKIDESFDEVCNDKYIDKLRKISDYITEKRKLDKDLEIFVYVEYTDDITVILGLGYDGITINKKSDESFEGSTGIDMGSGKYFKNYDLEEYLEVYKK